MAAWLLLIPGIILLAGVEDSVKNRRIPRSQTAQTSAVLCTTEGCTDAFLTSPGLLLEDALQAWINATWGPSTLQESLKHALHETANTSSSSSSSTTPFVTIPPPAIQNVTTSSFEPLYHIEAFAQRAVYNLAKQSTSFDDFNQRLHSEGMVMMVFPELPIFRSQGEKNASAGARGEAMGFLNMTGSGALNTINRQLQAIEAAVCASQPPELVSLMKNFGLSCERLERGKNATRSNAAHEGATKRQD